MKSKVHAGHTGINSCLRRARQYIFWPSMTAEIRQFVEACDTCASIQPRQPKQPLFLHDVPKRPWQKVGTDIFTIKGRNYLVTVDYFSQFFEVDYLQDTLSETVIHKLKNNFARHGIPEKLISDNGPQYISYDFKKFCRTYGIQHETISPGNSQANGASESAVKKAKQLFMKCHLNKEDPYIGLLNLRNTPEEGSNMTPVQRLYGRHTRTLLPTSTKVLNPQYSQQYREVAEDLKAKVGERYNDRKELPPLQLYDNVRIQPTNPSKETWKPATVTKQLSPRSYTVQTTDGKEYRRDRQHLRLSKSTKQPAPDEQSVSDSTVDNANKSVHNSPPNKNNKIPSGNDNQSSGNKTSPVNVNKNNNKYITRYGRVIKPPIKYSA